MPNRECLQVTSFFCFLMIAHKDANLTLKGSNTYVECTLLSVSDGGLPPND
jgi:hypothetical protein